MKSFLLFTFLLGCSTSNLIQIENTNYMYDTESEDICLMTDICRPIAGQILYRDDRCKEAVIGKSIPDKDLPSNIVVSKISANDNVYELGNSIYIKKGSKFFDRTERGCEESIFGEDDITYRLIK